MFTEYIYILQWTFYNFVFQKNSNLNISPLVPYSTDSKFPKLAYIKERGLHKYVNSRSQRSSRIIFRVCHITHVFGRSLIVAGLEQLASGKTKLAHRLETARLTAQGRDGLISSPDAGAGAGAGAETEAWSIHLFLPLCHLSPIWGQETWGKGPERWHKHVPHPEAGDSRSRRPRVLPNFTAF